MICCHIKAIVNSFNTVDDLDDLDYIWYDYEAVMLFIING